jgi:hypothetical protein
MSVSGRDRISVDLRGIRTSVVAKAATRAMTVSELVREVLVREAGTSGEVSSPVAPIARSSEGLMRVSLQMTRAQASALRTAARAAALRTGEYVAALVNGASSLGGQEPRGSSAAGLVASCAALSTLSRDLRHLTQLLGYGDVQAAREYRSRLDNVEVEVRRHLHLAAEVLGDLDALRAYRRAGSSSQE